MWILADRYVLLTDAESQIGTEARREGKGGKFFRAPQRLGASPSHKNTEKGVPDGFFLTSNMHKSTFGLRPGPRCGSLRRSPDP